MSTFHSDDVEPKQVVPVVAGNTRIILSVPEWALSLMVFVFFFITTGKFWWICFIAQIIFTMIYVLFLSKLEENIMSVLIQAAKLPDIVYGSFNKPMPLDKKEEKKNDFFNITE